MSGLADRGPLSVSPWERLNRARTGWVGRPPWVLVVGGLVIAALALLPLVYLVIRALGAEEQAVAFLARPRTIAVVAASLGLGLLVGIGTICIGVPIAWLTTRTDLPGRRAWAVLTAVPLAIPSYVVGFAFLGFFGPLGTLQGLLAPFGIQRLPSLGGLVGAVVVLTLVSYPYVSLATRAALLRVDPAVEESARLLGDRQLTVFRRITLPVLVPAIGAGTLLAVLYALSDFGAVSLLQFDSLSRAIYLQYGASFDRSLAAVLALVLVVITFVLTWGEGRLRSRAGTYASSTRRRPPRLVPLGRWRLPALAFCAVVVGLALDRPDRDHRLVAGPWRGPGPTAARGRWRGIRYVRCRRSQCGCRGGAGAARRAPGGPLPVEVLVVRGVVDIRWLCAAGHRRRPGARVPCDSVCPDPLSDDRLLILVYAVRFVPQAVGSLRAGLGTSGRRMEEAGRTLGDGPVRAFARLTLPYLRPAFVAGAALVFLTVVKELPLALLLAPIGFETLATEIWDAASSGFYARAAVPAALLMALSIATVAVLLRAEERA